MMEISIGTDLTSLSKEDIQQWVQENRDANVGEKDYYIAWQAASAYLVLSGIRNVTKAIVGEEFEVEE